MLGTRHGLGHQRPTDVSGSPGAAAKPRPIDQSDQTAAAVELRGLTVRYKNLVALNGIDLRIDKGEFFSLLGPSGCGKTTTLNIVGGFVEPDNGDVFIERRLVNHIPPYRRPVNTVFQSYALFPHMSVAENVGFGLRMAGTPAAEIAERIKDALALVSLVDFGGRRPDQLSGGQQQRVALARALINRPSVLLLDEPLGALDLKLRKQMQSELTHIQREIGITFIYVTHDQDEAMTMSDRIAVMNRGTVVQVGTPQEIYDRPASLFVADFIGMSNVCPGRVAGNIGTWAVVHLDTGPVVRVPGAAVPSGKVSVVVRPDHMALSLNAPSAVDVNGIPGTVAKVSFLGTHLQFTVATPQGGALTVIEPLSPNNREKVAPELGSQVHVTWPVSLSLCFSEEGSL
jgi:spermidine/putrescine transport system ATP-binding protein